MLPDNHDQPVGEATGEFIAENADNAGQADRESQPSVGEVTGEYTPEPQDGGDARAQRDQKFVQKNGGCTVDFEAPAAAAENTGEFVIDQRKSIKDLTGLRSLAHMTAPASLGAFPAPEPTNRSGRYFLKSFHAKGGMGEIWMAVDSDIGRPVAFKRMLKGRENHREQFIKEAQ